MTPILYEKIQTGGDGDSSKIYGGEYSAEIFTTGATPVKMVVDWCKDVLGETLQSKKNIAYSDVRKGTKTTLTLVCEN